ncbi:PspA/IM30 family protein [Microvirga massiliensis]|uniref:PspA/IM30 family protein n=1 Tax=Microvirga massiliensis TaxID=1033741 RepID=UPI00062BCBA7|nr:PspA/IM30 family protein [Microvirga massiliensis]
MFKFLVTLARGTVAAAEEEAIDRHALLLLDQQMRDATAAVERSRKALGLAIAQDQAEAKRLDDTLTRINDLETRAVAALKGDREDLATEAAEAIAGLEAERDAIRSARAAFGTEIASLKCAVSRATARLQDLERGRRIARAAEAVRRLRADLPRHGVADQGALAEAEKTLKRLREKQAEEAAAEAALESLDPETGADGISERLEAAGFGPRTRPTAADVLNRLRQKSADQTSA